MAITRLGGANAISGTIPQGNIANASLGAVTALPAAIDVGSMILLQTQTVSSAVAQVDFTSNLGTYDTVRIVYSGVSPSSDDNNLRLRVSTDGGSSYLTSTYNCSGYYVYSGGSNADYGNDTGFHRLGGNYGNASGENVSGYVELNNLSSTSLHKTVQSFTVGVHDLGHGLGSWMSCIIAQTSAINGVRFYFGSDNITAGKFSLYGIERS